MKYLKTIPLLIVLILSGCATGVNVAGYRAIDEAISHSDFGEGVRQIEQAQDGKRPLYNSSNAISLFLDKGFLEHYARDYRASANSLQNAERLIQEAFTKSITQGVATYIVNDNTREYPGEDFEDIYLSVFNALNYFQMGNTEGALVEVRKLTLPNGKLDMLERKYEEANAKAKKENEAALKRAENSNDATQLQVTPVTFTNSALARYLSVLFYQDDRNEDAVRIEMEQLHNAFTSQPNIYKNPPPSAIENLYSFPTGQARLDVISFVGLSPIKEEKAFPVFFPFFSDYSLRTGVMRLPVLVKRPSKIDHIEVLVGDQRFSLELLEDMGVVMEDTFNARFSTIFLKTYLRILGKYIATEIGGNAIAGKDNEGTAELLKFIGRITTDLSENADIRMSRYLPNKAFVGNINLEPGVYDITVNYYSHGRIIYRETQENVNVRANNLNLLQTVNLE